LGAIGLEIAEHLSQSVRAELVLTTRSPFPKESSWDQWLSDRDTDDVTSVRIRRIRSLKQAGSRVLVVTADVSDLAQMRAAVRLAERTFGRIQGVIHAAGLPGGGMMQLRSPSAIAEVLAPKVEGTAVLESLFSSANLDFMVLCSSLSSVTGATGLVDYCAANAFLEAHAHAQRRLGRNVVAINWNAWAGLGMASSRDFPAEFESWWAEFDRNSLTPAQGVDAFTRILKSGLAQVIVSSDHPTSIVKRAQLFQENASPARELAKKQHSRPKLGGAYVPPSNDAERTIAEIWEALLGMERVGASDNFFNLGGHSLLGTRVIARLQAAFQVDLPLRALFEAPTVATLARLIKDKQAAAEDGERTRLLEMLRDLPEDVVEKELAKRSGAERS
jgi:acyl carrier protein